MPALELLTPAGAEPVELAEAKTHLRVAPAATADNARITSLLKAARAWVESELRRKLVTQTWRLYLDGFPCGDPAWVETPGPAASVVQVRYYDAANVLQTLAASAYEADLKSPRARIAPVFGTLWPVTYPRLNAVQVDFTDGYGAAGGAVPDEVRQAVLLKLGDLYEGTDSTRAIRDLLAAAPVAH